MAPDPQPQPDPQPDPQPQPDPKPDNGKGNGKPASPDLAADVARLEAALTDERKRAASAEGQLTKLRNQNMTEHEKAIAEARAEGKAEAVKVAAVRLAAAEFRAAAVGRLVDPAATLAELDMTRYVDDDGEVDSEAIAKLVDRLAASLAAPPPAPGRIPGGPRETAPESTDFIRARMLGQR